ncbi:ATP-grasp domain-containing protein [Shimazuella soli]|uniref:ATP-grasp domain-containing protein n=1 Tax=Shimazuella soli TaxID=1892854 RepID=UPI001F10551E|nr:ATP-grasp domain-containing protein [Shimazuella soli]
MEPYFADSFAHYEEFASFHNNDAVSLRAVDLHTTYQFERIVAVSEYDLVRAAELREHLGIDGQKVHSAIQFRNKIKMKEALRGKCQKIRIPKFKQVEDIFDLLHFIDEVGYPIILKPIDGAGAAGITVLHEETDLWEFAKGGLHRKMDAEQFFEGEEYHIDGVIEDNELKLICASKYLEPMFHYHDQSFISGSYLLHSDNPYKNQIEEAMEEVIRILDFPAHAVFHGECLVTPSEEIIFIEIACRPGGGRISKTMEVAYGKDLLLVSAELQAGIAFGQNLIGQAPERLSGSVQAMSKEGTLVSFPKCEPPDWVYEYLQDVTEGTSFGDPKNSCDSVASFVVVGETEEEVKERLQHVLEWFEINTVWVTADSRSEGETNE